MSGKQWRHLKPGKNGVVKPEKRQKPGKFCKGFQHRVLL